MQHAKTRCSRSPGPLVLCLHTRTMRPYDLQTKAWRSISSCCSVHVDGIKNGWSRETTECAVHGQGKNVCPLSLWETNKWRLWFHSWLQHSQGFGKVHPKNRQNMKEIHGCHRSHKDGAEFSSAITVGWRRIETYTQQETFCWDISISSKPTKKNKRFRYPAKSYLEVIYF